MTLATTIAACSSCADPLRWPRPSARWTSCRAAARSPGSGRARRRATTPRPASRSRSAGGASTGPSPPCASCSTARGGRAPAPAGPAPGPADLGRELGLARRPAARGPAHGRRVAGLGLQHHPRALPRGGRRAPRDAQRARHGLALRHRGRRRGRTGRSPTSSPRCVGRDRSSSCGRCSLPIGPAEVCAERMRAFADAGVQRIFLWPLRDEARQLELFMERVAPLV